jgi:signal-transduction protein with cAMP-binding, CBS, and nucleotidyltransferase domain
VSAGIVVGVLVAWGRNVHQQPRLIVVGACCLGRHVHQQPRLIIVEATVRYMLGKNCFVTVVEDNNSGEIFVRVRNFEQMKRLSSVTVFAGGDSVIFTHIDRLNTICQPSDMSALEKMRCLRH